MLNLLAVKGCNMGRTRRSLKCVSGLSPAPEGADIRLHTPALVRHNALRVTSDYALALQRRNTLRVTP